MKVIDLLNKIANGEIDRNNKYQFSKDDYCTINDFFARYIVDEENLNLEIIEEENEKANIQANYFMNRNDELEEIIDDYKSRIDKAVELLNNEDIIVKLQEFENKYTVNYYDKKLNY